jgi:NACHT domain
LEQTRVDVLRDIDRWAMDDSKGMPWIFVLQGLAGTGKSTLAHTVCETIAKRGWLGASFFFSRNEANCSNPFLVFTTIAYQLATRYPQFHNALTAILKRDPDVVGLTLEMQLEKLVVEPIRAAADDIGSDPVIVVIDAVDECGNYRAQILSLLCNARPKLPIRFKLFVSLRPEHDLQTSLLSQGTNWGAESFILHDVDASVVRGDIERFLHFRLSKVAANYPEIIDPRLWPSPEAIASLTEKSDKLFIFAATVVKFIEDTDDDPRSQLDVVLRTTVRNGPSPYQQLDQLYQQVLEHAFPESTDDAVLERFRTVMGAVTLLYDTLTIFALGRLLQMEAGRIRMALLRLHSVIIVPDHENEIRLIHKSFRDFMTQRCPARSRYFIKPADCHRQLVLTCFKTMNDYLRKDICGIRDMWKLNAEVKDLDDRITACIPAHLQYACRHWATHLSEALSCADSAEDDVCAALTLFSSLHLLHWLEVLSLTGRLAEALPALRHAQDWASVSHIYIECTRRLILMTYPHRSHTRLQTSSVICFMTGSDSRLSSFRPSVWEPCISIIPLYHSLLKVGSCVRYITTSWAA